jgi:hypothetical protein
MEKGKKLALKKGEGMHTHTLTSSKDFSFEKVKDIEDSFQLQLKEKASLTHEEHGEIILKPGNYITCGQVEFDPMSRNIRQVFD